MPRHAQEYEFVFEDEHGEIQVTRVNVASTFNPIGTPVQRKHEAAVLAAVHAQARALNWRVLEVTKVEKVQVSLIDQCADTDHGYPRHPHLAQAQNVVQLAAA